jgi:hypothetical protein
VNARARRFSQSGLSLPTLLVTLKLGELGAQNNLPVEKLSQPKAEELLNVSERSIQATTVVRDRAAPELGRRVERGEVSASAAADGACSAGG